MHYQSVPDEEGGAPSWLLVRGKKEILSQFLKCTKLIQHKEKNRLGREWGHEPEGQETQM